jgi:ABC-type amino acid transport system permease subunit
MRRVVLPQAVTRVIPPMATMWVALFKDTAILSAIGVAELKFRAREIATDTYRPLEIFTLAAVIYFALTFPQSIALDALYRRFRTQE